MNRPDGDTPRLSPLITATLDLWRRDGKAHVIPVTGDSMFPLLRDGDRVWVSHGRANLTAGDVAVFWQDGQLRVHRVIRVYAREAQPNYLTKGDHVPNLDAPIHVEQIVGQVIAVQRNSQEFSTATWGWRAAGRFIVAATLIQTTLFALGSTIKQRLFGPRPNRLTHLLHQGLSKTFEFVFRIALTFIHRVL